MEICVCGGGHKYSNHSRSLDIWKESYSDIFLPVLRAWKCPQLTPGVFTEKPNNKNEGEEKFFFSVSVPRPDTSPTPGATKGCAQLLHQLKSPCAALSPPCTQLRLPKLLGALGTDSHNAGSLSRHWHQPPSWVPALQSLFLGSWSDTLGTVHPLNYLEQRNEPREMW